MSIGLNRVPGPSPDATGVPTLDIGRAMFAESRNHLVAAQTVGPGLPSRKRPIPCGSFWTLRCFGSLGRLGLNTLGLPLCARKPSGLYPVLCVWVLYPHLRVCTGGPPAPPPPQVGLGTRILLLATKEALCVADPHLPQRDHHGHPHGTPPSFFISIPPPDYTTPVCETPVFNIFPHRTSTFTNTLATPTSKKLLG